jgi:hypothetical protein
MEHTSIMYTDTLPLAWVVVAGARAWVVPAVAGGWHHRTQYLGAGLMPAAVGLSQMSRWCCEIPDAIDAQ